MPEPQSPHHHDASRGHRHGEAPHPAQHASWSMLGMTLPARLGGALLICAALWACVLMAMR